MQKKKARVFTPAYLTKVAVLSALAYVLYAYARFPIFAVFPFSVLDFDFSYVPSLLGGFALGPTAPIIIETIKSVIKILSTSSNTFYIGDLSNYIVSLSFVLPSAIYYRTHRTLKGAIIGLLIGYFIMLICSSLSNYFIIVPLYAKFMPSVLEVRTLFAFGYGLAFNIIKGLVSAIIVMVSYKRLSPVLKLDKQKLKEMRVFGTTKTSSAKETEELGMRLAKRLKGSETIVLEGDLGAGKTTFTKGLAKGLGVEETILSPTFVIVKSYKGEKLTLNHIDMYRLEDEEETEALGLDTILYDSNGVTVIEWNKLDLIGKIIDVKILYDGEDLRHIEIKKRNDTKKEVAI